jgi:hypothetical protein
MSGAIKVCMPCDTQTVRTMLEKVRERDLSRQKNVRELMDQTWSRKSSKVAT